jgi:hypothetical protein
LDFVSPLGYIIVVVNTFINGSDSVNQVNIADAINVAVNSAGITQSIGQGNQYGSSWSMGSSGTINRYNYGNANNYAADSMMVDQAIG